MSWNDIHGTSVPTPDANVPEPKTPSRFSTWYDRHGRTIPAKPGSPRETIRGLPAGGASTPIPATPMYSHVKRRVRKRQHLTGARLVPCQVLNHGTALLTCRDNPPRGRIMIGFWPHLPHRRFPGAFLPSLPSGTLHAASSGRCAPAPSAPGRRAGFWFLAGGVEPERRHQKSLDGPSVESDAPR